MNNFFDKMRSGAGKAAFEADKLRRVTTAQAELRGLRDELQKSIALVGRVAFDLHQRGQVGPPELRTVCEQAAAALALVNGKESDIERIRAEQFVEPSFANYEPAGALLCPAGHGPLPGGARYCQHCGQPGISPAAPPAFACPTCNAPLEADARFCANCGQPLAASPTPPAPPASPAPPPRLTDPNQPPTVRLGGNPSAAAVATCPSCGAPTPDPDAPFCLTCGYPLQRAA